MENLEPHHLVATSPDDLLNEIREKGEKSSLASALVIIGIVFLGLGLLGLITEWQQQTVIWALGAVGLFALLSFPWANWRDRRALRTKIYYDFDELGLQVREAISRLTGALERAEKVWSVRTEDHHGDWKRNAGAGVSVDRRQVQVGWGGPPRIETNVRIGHLTISSTKLYLFPDRLLVYGPGGIQAVRYTELTLEPGTVRFVEEEGVPRDAVVLGTTWRYVNRDGGPDLRFSNNRQLPVVQYGILDVSAPNGLRLRLQLSANGLAEGSAKLLGLVQAAIKDLQSRGALQTAIPRHEAEGTDLPPLVGPALKAAQIGASALEYRWLASLPEWTVPIIWGLVFALPIVALILTAAQGLSVSTGVFLGVAVLFSGCGVPVLARDRSRAVAAQRAAETEERRSHFRAALISNLRSQPSERVAFHTMVADCGLSPREANSVAEELYRLMADRVVSDGVITTKEEQKLRLLVKALDLAPEQATRIESEAKSSRYRQAVSEVLADGVISPEESRMLDELRANLGVSNAGWPSGDLIPRE